MEKEVSPPRNTVAEATRTAFERFLRAVQGWSPAKATTGAMAARATNTKTRKKPGAAPSTRWPPAGQPVHAGAWATKLYIYLLVSLFVRFFVALFVCIVL